MHPTRTVVVVVCMLAIGACGGSPAASQGPAATTSTPSANQTSAGAAELPILHLDASIGGLSATVAVVASTDAIWVLDHNPPAVLRVDPATNKVNATIELGTGYANGLGIAGGRVWTFHQSTGEVVAIDVKTAKIVEKVAIGQDGDLFWVGGDAAWIISGGQLVRIDGATAKAGPLPLDASCAIASAASDSGFVWLASESGAICKLDAHTGAVVAKGTAAGSGAGLTIVDSEPWLASADNGLVVVDPSTLSVTATVPAPAPGRFQGSTYSLGRAGGENTVIVGSTDGTSGWVRYTGATIGHVALGGAPAIALFAGLPADTLAGGVVEAFGSLWVANFGPGTLERYTLPTP